eukprot:359394-Chlamydomonas_euryale.AAC.2
MRWKGSRVAGWSCSAAPSKTPCSRCWQRDATATLRGRGDGACCGPHLVLVLLELPQRVGHRRHAQVVHLLGGVSAGRLLFGTKVKTLVAEEAQCSRILGGRSGPVFTHPRTTQAIGQTCRRAAVCALSKSGCQPLRSSLRSAEVIARTKPASQVQFAYGLQCRGDCKDQAGFSDPA